ncbi:hypothetical protein FSP39_008873 [Pinctada imbricata]|uniref:Pleckstrin homology domain-containing family A member 8 n=1 Tax=Pinctada imbricata TaxID=66713 RepID=A0AA88XHH1_PINIB|nr:hypothetical protein FSP39_008873 [Pinctada imbricata]
MSVCDISVHSTDRCRLDLIIPGEQHFYIRASSPQERQQWLVALGTAKASLTTNKTTEQAGEISPDIVRTKKSELRLYCDLLMQQVHSVKTAANESTPPDVQKLDDATALLSATCDTFINTLEDCMRIANASIKYESPHRNQSDPSFPVVTLKQPQKKHTNRMSKSLSLSEKVHTFPERLSASSRTRSASETSFSNSDLSETDQSSPRSGQPRSPSHTEDSKSNQSQPLTQNSNVQNSNANGNSLERTNRVQIDQNSANSDGHSSSMKRVQSEEEFKDAIDDKVPTFFSTMNPSFMDLQLGTDGGIPVEMFLGSCKSLVPFFDKLNSKAFAPVKMDFQGNIRKLHQKFTTNPSTYSTLQNMIIAEMNSNQQHLSSSATVALLWMKRSLEFIKEFLAEMYKGEQDLSTAASNSYSRSLKPFHGWVVRGVFAVAVKALPYRNVFLSMLGVEGDESEGSDFMQCLMSDMENYITALDVVIKILNDFYRLHSLESNDQI